VAKLQSENNSARSDVYFFTSAVKRWDQIYCMNMCKLSSWCTANSVKRTAPDRKQKVYLPLTEREMSAVNFSIINTALRQAGNCVQMLSRFFRCTKQCTVKKVWWRTEQFWQGLSRGGRTGKVTPGPVTFGWPPSLKNSKYTKARHF